jgi:hypothetical protein
MKKLVSVLVLAGVLGVVPIVPASASASAAGAGCVTMAEYRRVDVGMRQARVRNIFDTSGRRISSHGRREEYAYDACTAAIVFVTYRDNLVVSKSWVRGE